MLVSQNTESFPLAGFILTNLVSSNLTSNPVRWLKYPNTVCLIISVCGVFCDWRMSYAVSNLSRKQSSLLMVFSPTHTASRNKFAVHLGSSP
ncbi:hypothetical protein QL285_048356 [Trifolium repens]|nr:hypothetical protein QL285_048356 [Trifolium repens]